MKRFRWEKKYLYWGVTAFVVIAACIVFFLLISNLDSLRGALRRIGEILSPFIWGLVFAYLLYPMMRIYSNVVFTPLSGFLVKKFPKFEKHSKKFARGLSVLLAIVTMLFAVGLLIYLIAPQIYSSVETIVVNSGDYIARADAWLDDVLHRLPQEQRGAISNAFGDLSNGVVNWATNNLLPQMQGLLSSLTINMVNIVRSIYNIFIGIVVSVYVMYSMETFAGRFKKALYCIFSLEMSEKILEGVRFTNQVFMSFLSGKLLDSAIIGILCFLGCTILRMPYTLLVAVTIGVTNIIPFFGPFIGAIPSAFIILTDSPLKALIFVIFIILLQQFDGNILGPKILGNRVGINGFWVLFSIILGAGLFGFFGMLLGVPVFVVIYSFIKELADQKLKRSELPIESSEYVELDHIDPQSGKAVMLDHAERRAARRKKPTRKKTGADPSAPEKKMDDSRKEDVSDGAPRS